MASGGLKPRMIDDRDREYMALALALAEKGRATTSPNPMVGAVVVNNGGIVGRGWHRKAGGPHAEVEAISDAGCLAKDSTIYVTLEPCSHYGRTPPCAELIIESGISRVVAAMTDDNPKVSGRGCAMLREKGIEVETGLMEAEARKLNEAYLKHITTGLPFVTLKLATTLDGFIADKAGQSKWITGPETRKFVHRLRAETDAIMVGSGTIQADNPSLNVRDADGDDPLRVLVDSKLSTPPDAKALTGAEAIVATCDNVDEKSRVTIENTGAEVWRFPAESGRVPLKSLLEKLGERDIMTVLCEGGAGIAASLLTERLADKVIFTIAPKMLGCGLNALKGFDPGGIGNALELDDTVIEIIDGDIIVSGYPKASIDA